MSQSGMQRGSLHGCTHFYSDSDPHASCPQCRLCSEEEPCDLCVLGPSPDLSSVTPILSYSGRKTRSADRGKGKRKASVDLSKDLPSDGLSPAPSLLVKVSSQGVAPPSQPQSGSWEGQPGSGLVRPGAELTGTPRKPFQSLPLGRGVSRSAVSNVVGDSGVPVASGSGGGHCPEGLSGNPPGLQLAPLAVGNAPVADSRSGHQSSFPPGQSLPGSGPSGAGPGFSMAGNPSFVSGYGSVDQSGGFRPALPPSPRINPACAQGFLGQPNQPVSGLGIQNPGSYGSAPYMSGSATGGSGGYPSTFGQGFQPQSQAGQLANSWGHSQPMGPPSCPRGLDMGPSPSPSGIRGPWSLPRSSNTVACWFPLPNIPPVRGPSWPALGGDTGPLVLLLPERSRLLVSPRGMVSLVRDP